MRRLRGVVARERLGLALAAAATLLGQEPKGTATRVCAACKPAIHMPHGQRASTYANLLDTSSDKAKTRIKATG